MDTNSIKQFSMSDNDIIIAEVLEETEEYILVNNVQEILIHFEDEEETELSYALVDYYTAKLFEPDRPVKLYYSNIVMESNPDTHILLNYIGIIKTKQKIKNSKSTSKEKVVH